MMSHQSCQQHKPDLGIGVRTSDFPIQHLDKTCYYGFHMELWSFHMKLEAEPISKALNSM